MGWGGVGGHVNVPCTSYMIYCYAAEIFGRVHYVTCCYAAEIFGMVYYVTCYLLLGSGGAFTRMLTANCLPRMRCSDEAAKGKRAAIFPGFPIIKLARHCGKINIVQSDDAENRKNAPQVFPGFPIIKLARHCGKITIF